jgi:hypothetical protein
LQGVERADASILGADALIGRYYASCFLSAREVRMASEGTGRSVAS